ncbi:hypothetical protein FXO37_30227 [Capsicum annuum]|nr:hypothetical protein FXO37_30227 [Capsicum annuum]
MKVDGTIDKYKARLVVKVFKSKKGPDYFDTYSLITRITSIQMLIALAAVYSLEIHQMDVKTTFLNEELEEEIYMEQPEGFVIPGNENKDFYFCRFSIEPVVDGEVKHCSYAELNNDFGWDKRLKVATQLADLFSWLHMNGIAVGSINSNLYDKFSVKYYPMLLWGPPKKFVGNGWDPKQENSEILAIEKGRTTDILLGQPFVLRVSIFTSASYTSSILNKLLQTLSSYGFDDGKYENEHLHRNSLDPAQPSDTASGPILPMDARRPRDDSEPNDSR